MTMGPGTVDFDPGFLKPWPVTMDLDHGADFGLWNGTLDLTLNHVLGTIDRDYRSGPCTWPRDNVLGTIGPGTVDFDPGLLKLWPVTMDLDLGADLGLWTGTLNLTLDHVLGTKDWDYTPGPCTWRCDNELGTIGPGTVDFDPGFLKSWPVTMGLDHGTDLGLWIATVDLILDYVLGAIAMGH